MFILAHPPERFLFFCFNKPFRLLVAKVGVAIKCYQFKVGTIYWVFRLIVHNYREFDTHFVFNRIHRLSFFPMLVVIAVEELIKVQGFRGLSFLQLLHELFKRFCYGFLCLHHEVLLLGFAMLVR